ncbi:MAG: MarR family winged helix-turn-helix transcriptional regulator [Porcipelethomonas sp.]
MCFEFMALGNMLRRYADNSSSLRYVEKYTGSNCWILEYIFHNSGHDVFQKDLEEAFSIRRSTVSKAINLMEKKGLIKRESVDYDARLKKLVPTGRAIELREMLKKDMRALGERFTEKLTDEEIEQFLVILRKIRKNFE